MISTGIGMCIKAGFGLSLKDKVVLYQNCTIFDNPDIYGGPICGDNGVTYANSLYLDCKNHHSHDTGKLILYSARKLATTRHSM